MNLLFILIYKELKDFFSSKSVLVFFIILTFFLGYSFITAVSLYSEQSIAAEGNPVYATGFEPSPGVFVPVFGGIFLVFSLLLPFVFIRSIYEEKRNNTIALLRQLPCPLSFIIISKTIASLFLIFCGEILIVPLLLIWHSMGGHLPVNELILLFSGYALYGLFVMSVSFFSASVFNSAANASIGALILIIISWIIDFGKDSSQTQFLSFLSPWTVTANLKIFEHGILSFSAVAYFIILPLMFLALTCSFLALSDYMRYIRALLIISASVVVLYFISFISLNKDLTESRKNSFSPLDAGILKNIPAFEVDIYLRREDSRFKDFQNSFLKKLKLLRNDITVKFMTGRQLSEKYGLFVYKLNGKSAQTYSNSEEEILPALCRLADLQYSPGRYKDDFPGYPLVVHSGFYSVKFIYYLIIPFILVIIYIMNIYFRKKVFPLKQQ
jgi:ABC-type transport system involved in multi-copper enzyme maturation permease subunit